MLRLSAHAKGRSSIILAHRALPLVPSCHVYVCRTTPSRRHAAAAALIPCSAGPHYSAEVLLYTCNAVPVRLHPSHTHPYFPHQTTLMLSEPKWNFDLYLRAAREQRIAAGAHGWRLKVLPWLRNSAVVQQLEVHDRVVAAMQPGDRADPVNLGAEAKSKIASRSGCTLQQVNSVIKQVLPRSPPSLFISQPASLMSCAEVFVCHEAAPFVSSHAPAFVCR